MPDLPKYKIGFGSFILSFDTLVGCTTIKAFESKTWSEICSIILPMCSFVFGSFVPIPTLPVSALIIIL